MPNSNLPEHVETELIEQLSIIFQEYETRKNNQIIINKLVNYYNATIITLESEKESFIFNNLFRLFTNKSINEKYQLLRADFIDFESKLIREQEKLVNNEYSSQLCKLLEQKISFETIGKHILLMIFDRCYHVELHVFIPCLERLYINENCNSYSKFLVNDILIESLEGFLQKEVPVLFESSAAKHLPDYEEYIHNEVKNVNKIRNYLKKSNDLLMSNPDFEANKIKKPHNLIFRYLDQYPKTKELENEYDKLNIAHKIRYGFDLPLSGYLFDEIKEKSQELKNNKIEYLKKELHHWTELSLIDSDVISCPEIKDKLIPLLKNEIELLQLASNTSSGKNLTGFQSCLTNQQIERLYNHMQGNYFDTTIANFVVIFRNEPLPQYFVPVKRLKKFTVVLLAYFISELFQKENQHNYWNIAEYCFNTKNLRQSFNNAYQLNPNQKPRGYKDIDTILKNIYRPLQ